MMTYDPRRVICLVPGEEPPVGHKTTREKELSRQAYYDGVAKRYEQRKAEQKRQTQNKKKK